MIRAVVVDDEPLARERLRTLCRREPDVEVVAECGDGRSALGVIEAGAPDLLFLDIQMPELDGFEVLLSLDVRPPAIVFVTAYDRYALRAFDVAAVDYLLKPIAADRFADAVARAREKLAPAAERPDSEVRRLLDQVRSEPRYAERFVVRLGDQVYFVRVPDVEWIEATGNYVRLYAGGRAHIVRDTMKAVEARLDPGRFVRIHRSVIVQIDCIASMSPHLHGEWEVVMRDGRRFVSGRSYAAHVRALLK